ncbi:MAG TPA: peptidylprolyl isomerase [Ignavibacteriaceae bacterium]|nr:peptidylprolyl isomerase [Ignavibacteriaceae bacterium]
MKFKFSIILSIISIVSSSLPGKEKNEIVATVGTHSISLNQFEERYSGYLFYSGVKDNLTVRQSILNNMVNELLLRYYDNNKNILNDPEYKKESEWTKNQALLAFLKDREIYAKISVSEEEIRDAFVMVNKKIAARHLFAETEEEADNLYELLKIGVDFNYLARQTFSDSVLRNNGGYLGYFSWGNMDPAFEEAAYSMKIGEISKPVKTEYGYSIIKIDDIISDPLLTETQFLNKKHQLERLIKISKKKPSEIEYINRIIDRDKVSFNDEVLNKFLSAFLTENSNSFNEFEKLKSALNPESACAEYNGSTYKVSDLMNWINELPSSYDERIKTLDDLKNIIKGFFIQEKLLQIARRKGYDKDPELLKTSAKMEDNLFLEHKNREIVDNSQVSDSEALEFYRKNVDLFSREKELNVQEIILQDPDSSQVIIKRLKHGEEFGRLAKEYSIRKWSAENGGEMGFAPVSKFGMLKDTLWNSEIGSLVGPIKVQDYYGIFKVLGKINQKPFEFSEIKEKVVSAVRLEKRKPVMENYLKEIQKKINVQINQELLRTFIVAS